MLKKFFVSFLLLTGCICALAEPPAQQVRYYGLFSEASAGSIQPQGWLKELLHRQVEGLAKHHAVSGYPYDTCLWAGTIPPTQNPEGKAWWPYEQAGYLVDGLERLGLVTQDATLLAEARASVNYILDHPMADGSLGPGHIGPNNWPHAVVFRALIADYGATHDPRIPEAMRKHFLARPADFGVHRDAVNVETMLWTYAQTRDPKLLEIAKRTYDNFNATKAPTMLSALADDRKIVEHGVTFNEIAKLPAMLYCYTGDKSLLNASLNAFKKIDRDHMLASGMHTAEEKLNGQDPWNYTETCDVTDYTWSVGYVLMAIGDVTWADHIEKAIFNAGIGAITKDFKSHQYFSSPNQVIVTHGICKKYDPDRFAYRPGHDVECCSGNVHRFLPNYALRQWMTGENGAIVATLYGPSRYKTMIDGAAVSIDEQTEYPFSEAITFAVRASKPATFALVLRIPGWTSDATIDINGEPFTGQIKPGAFTTIRRTFQDGDVIKLNLPMRVNIHPWANKTASIERGPLVYSLKIEEEAKEVHTFKTSPDFPAWDKRPASPWNYALVLKDLSAPNDVKVSHSVNGFPWETGHSPIALSIPARQITNWQLPVSGENPGFPTSPKFANATQSITLVPYGTTCLRLTVFPIASTK